LTYSQRVKPTRIGLKYVEEKRNPANIIGKVGPTAGETLGRFLRGLFGGH